jgi:predicted metal-binding membrane protein
MSATAMSMMWMRMPGQTWTSATAAFAGMWMVMMAPMMLPSLAPTMWRFRGANSGIRLTLVGVGYFFVWAVVGVAVFPFGIAVATLEMNNATFAHGVPILSAVVVLLAGVLQVSSWKARHLPVCRGPLEAKKSAWRQGVCLGLRCAYSCAPLTASLLVFGMNDRRAMVVVAAAITAERVAPHGARVAQGSGAVVIATGLMMIVHAVV